MATIMIVVLFLLSKNAEKEVIKMHHLCVGKNKFVKLSSLRCLAGFKQGDIIRCEAEGFSLGRRKLTIKGFSRGYSSGRRWKYVIWAIALVKDGQFGKRRSVPLYEKKGLILLERPGLPFKVGDKVICAGYEQLCRGQIIVMDPKETTPNYLVRFSGYKDGYDGYFSSMKNWYPRRLINKKAIDRRWFSKDELQ
jgi:hypothetical protein